MLSDGVITPDERARLEKAADNLGIDPSRLLRLEQAMVSAYQTRHKIEIVEHYEEPVASLAPLRVEAEGDAGRALLLKRIEQLETRVKELEEELKRAQSQVNVEVDLRELESEVEEASEDPEEVWRRVRRNPLDPRRCVSSTASTPHGAIAIGAGASRKRWWRSRRATTRSGRCTRRIVRAGSSRRAPGSRRTPGTTSSSTPKRTSSTGQIFSLIAPAVLLGRVTTLRRDGRLHQPPPAALQDPAKATVTAVRALPWAAAILGLQVPRIYVERDRDTGYEHIPGVPPVTVVGKRVALRGALSRSTPSSSAGTSVSTATSIS